MTSETSSTDTQNQPGYQPQRHRNLVLGSIQLLGWLFVLPSAWRGYIAQIDDRLRPDFYLAELNADQWQHPVLRQLLVMVYLIIPLLALLLLDLGLSAVGLPQRDIIAGLATALGFGLTFSLSLGATTSVAMGVAGGTAVIIVLAIPVSFAVSMLRTQGISVPNMATHSSFSLAAAISYGVVGGLRAACSEISR